MKAGQRCEFCGEPIECACGVPEMELAKAEIERLRALLADVQAAIHFGPKAEASGLKARIEAATGKPSPVWGAEQFLARCPSCGAADLGPPGGPPVRTCNQCGATWGLR